MSAPAAGPGPGADAIASGSVMPRLLRLLALGCAVAVLLAVGLAVSCYRWLSDVPPALGQAPRPGMRATSSISIRAPFGSPAAATVERAGRWSPKASA